jgi:hypothetical protein
MKECNYWQTEAYIEADMALVSAMDDIPPGFEYPENDLQPCGECEACVFESKVDGIISFTDVEDDHLCDRSMALTSGDHIFCPVCGEEFK